MVQQTPASFATSHVVAYAQIAKRCDASAVIACSLSGCAASLYLRMLLFQCNNKSVVQICPLLRSAARHELPAASPQEAQYVGEIDRADKILGDCCRVVLQPHGQP